MHAVQKKINQRDNLLFEPALQGIRVMAIVQDDPILLNEQRIDVGEQYPDIVKSLYNFDKGTVLDGVISKDKKYHKLTLFDILKLNGHNTRNFALQKRKNLLKALIDKNGDKYVEYLKVAKDIQSGKKLIAKSLSDSYDPKSTSSWILVSDRKIIVPSPVKKSKSPHVSHLDFPDETEESFGRKKLRLTNLNKLYWKKEKIKKGMLLEYYRSISDFILPYLKDRPLSLNRHPNGIDSPNFFQKDLDTEKIPSWIKSQPLHSESNDKDIDYLIANDLPTLLWMVNLGCIEINPWLSTYKNPEKPLFAVLDLDPNDVEDFDQVIEVALTAKKLLDGIGIKPYIKTSGSRGLHIFIYVAAKYDYEIVKNFVQFLGTLILKEHPDTTSLERSPSKRKKKIYLDFLQNRRGQTIAAPYSVRPKSGATVSTPLDWEEVNSSLDVKSFTMFNTKDRIDRLGDVWNDIYTFKNDLKLALKKIGKSHPS